MILYQQLEIIALLTCNGAIYSGGTKVHFRQHVGDETGNHADIPLQQALVDQLMQSPQAGGFLIKFIFGIHFFQMQSDMRGQHVHQFEIKLAEGVPFYMVYSDQSPFKVLINNGDNNNRLDFTMITVHSAHFGLDITAVKGLASG